MYKLFIDCVHGTSVQVCRTVQTLQNSVGNPTRTYPLKYPFLIGSGRGNMSTQKRKLCLSSHFPLLHPSQPVCNTMFCMLLLHNAMRQTNLNTIMNYECSQQTQAPTTLLEGFGQDITNMWQHFLYSIMFLMTYMNLHANIHCIQNHYFCSSSQPFSYNCQMCFFYHDIITF